MTDIDEAQARAAARLSNDYLLRTVRLLVDLHRGELLRAVILQAISAANTSHVDRKGPLEPGAEPVPPDSARRPVSVSAVSQGLGLPFETVRRNINRMIEEGLCVRVRGGVIVPEATMRSEKATAAAAVNLQNLRKLYRDLRRAGVEV
ncbi:MAG TPA: DeoR family transcriptional regulator [Caulobacteraceae bacterium]|nr:DeoR family transcriptional regulator [Caulobacteraceae bacterium]